MYYISFVPPSPNIQLTFATGKSVQNIDITKYCNKLMTDGFEKKFVVDDDEDDDDDATDNDGLRVDCSEITL